MEKHTLHRFDEELNNLVTQMLKMGGLVEKQLQDSLLAVEQMDIELAESVIETEDKVNDMEVKIDKLCSQIIAMRQPTASDLRLIIGVSKSVGDLERIGDEVGKVAEMVISIHEKNERTDKFHEIHHLGEKVIQMLAKALDAYGRFDTEAAVDVAMLDKGVDQEYRSTTRSLVTYMMEDPRTIASVLNVMWTTRSLERVGDHIQNLAEQLIYTVKGIDVRHDSLKQMKKRVLKS
ncbi:UNVERIFIED_CONTAM: hypothetical protein GTU68_025873 [Idotea baltica]|nr:hypothetical protein [Idotea baltica]